MLIPDVNLLIYAYNADAPFHTQAREWWADCMNGREQVALPWVVLLGFLRLTTSRAVFVRPFPPADAIDIIRSWIDRSQTRLVEPGPNHLSIIHDLTSSLGTAGRLTTDLHIAALSIELNATVHSNDGDFLRMSGVRIRNPLAER